LRSAIAGDCCAWPLGGARADEQTTGPARRDPTLRCRTYRSLPGCARRPGTGNRRSNEASESGYDKGDAVDEFAGGAPTGGSEPTRSPLRIGSASAGRRRHRHSASGRVHSFPSSSRGVRGRLSVSSPRCRHRADEREGDRWCLLRPSLRKKGTRVGGISALRQA
jgi:hypothetical protein